MNSKKLHLDINFTLSICHKHKHGKTIIYLNFDSGKNIEINLQRKKFEEYVDQSSLKDVGWFVVPSFRKYKIEKERRHFKCENIVEFVLRRGLLFYSKWIFFRGKIL